MLVQVKGYRSWDGILRLGYMNELGLERCLEHKEKVFSKGGKQISDGRGRSYSGS